MDLNVSKLTAELCIVVLFPVLLIEACHDGENLVRSNSISTEGEEDERLELFDHSLSSQLGHEHLESTKSTDVGSDGEEDGVPTSFSMENSKLLTIGEKFGVMLDVVCAFQTQVEAELLLTLDKLVDVVEGSGLLASKHDSLVIASREALLHVCKRIHFYIQL